VQQAIALSSLCSLSFYVEKMMAGLSSEKVCILNNGERGWFFIGGNSRIEGLSSSVIFAI